MMADAYPLKWPLGKTRTRRQERSRFGVSFAIARDTLLKELSLMGVSLPVLSTNIPLRRDGLPYANQPEPEDTGVAIYFIWKKRQMCFTCDRWDKTKDNIQAIKHTISALRGLERWGTGDMVEAAFTGFEALPPPTSNTSWCEILGIDKNSTLETAEIAFRRKAKIAHPDKGGSQGEMSALNNAIKEARQLAKVKE
jgi:hypothetical protein